ncbi:heavy metal translocating P-type ATPase [Geosporobacter ferrireducens]|uniref:Cd(2+)-exporting ATPase n=1 Tax=Geosporobacter ferrireducens TaxID=1424294 RepID=A0A1D8GH28_9FIRM|nr:cation-translocating P-type ATPase [Geosporobacter ferrireducens]AOT70216.1 copper-translocating P-type ATPase [Geosporobacter ferrireducens]MTI53234.1 cation-translocating P-type ATPase [Geosporobacter ferrireducens]
MKELEILSFVPGRIRIKYQAIYQSYPRAIQLEQHLYNIEGIQGVRITSVRDSILILYNEDQLDQRKICKLITGQNLSIPNGKKELQRKYPRKLDVEETSIAYQKKQVIAGGLVLTYTFVKTIILGIPIISLGPLNIASVTTVITGYALFKNGIRGLLVHKKFNNDLLITAATVLSLAMNEYMTGLVVIGLINLSELFEAMTVDRSRKAIRSMLDNNQEKAWLLVDGIEVSVSTEQLKVGDTVVIHSGEKIPVDGIVLSGEAVVNQGPITGESVPIIKEKGETAFAGTIVEQGKIFVQASKVGDDTSISRIIHMIEEASTTRAPIQNIADIYADKLVPYSFLLSGLVYLFTADFVRAVTILIVACPCAAGLATPTALAAALGNAAKKGILIKGGRYLEEIGQVDTVLFDKTGTLTKGKPYVTSIYMLGQEVNQEETMYLAACCEQGNRHPLATAVVSKALEMGIKPETPEAVEVVVGRGVIAAIRDDQIVLGSKRMMKEQDIDTSIGMEVEEKMKAAGETTIYMARNGALAALIGIKDVVKEESAGAVDGLKQRRIENIAMITGDHQATAEAIAVPLGIENIYSDVLPEGKAAIVRQEKEKGRKVLMVGDGVNDSPALAIADVGVAMGTGGTDIAIETADIVLAGDDPQKIVKAVDISRETIGVIKQSYGIAIGINGLGVLLGAGRLISPFMAAILHNLSTVGVVLNSSRLLKYDPMKKSHKM